MRRKTVQGIMLSLLLIGMLILTFNIQPVKASGTIYVRADGSVEPSTANITTVDNITYTFTDNNYDQIIVERDNIELDGAGYLLQGIVGFDVGIYLQERSNVTIKNMEIKTANWAGIHLNECSNVSIRGNTITNNFIGILVEFCSNNIISGNTLSKNVLGTDLWESNGNTFIDNTISTGMYGIWVEYSNCNRILQNTLSNYGTGILPSFSTSNCIYHNNFIDNNLHVNIVTPGYANFWDNGYPSGGNYWSDYTGVDVKSGPNQDQPSSDGIGDTAYVIDENNRDNYPFMNPDGWLLHQLAQLTVTSSPVIGIAFTIDGISETTPYTRWLFEGSYTLEMPETHGGYVWSHWLEDGDTNRIKTILLQSTTWTAVYEPAPKPVGGKATPINIPTNKPELQSPWIWLSAIIFSLAVTVLYVKKRKRRTEINS